MTMKHDLAHIERCFDIDEATTEIPPGQSSKQQAPLGYGKLVDAHRLVAVSEGGGWWNPTTQELIPILPEDHPDYRQNEAIITEAIAAGIEGHQNDRPANCGRQPCPVNRQPAC